MRIIRVIECWDWVNVCTGAQKSMLGPVPWKEPRERVYWCLQHVGYTWQLSSGAIGIGRPPAATREQAEAIMADFNGLAAA